MAESVIELMVLASSLIPSSVRGYEPGREDLEFDPKLGGFFLYPKDFHCRLIFIGKQCPQKLHPQEFVLVKG